MINWTDTCINWHQLGSTETKRLIATWGMTERQIANYDKKHGIVHAAPKAPAKVVKSTAKKITTKVTKPVRQKHTGADGEVKFVEHRNLYVGFMGGKVVVTKRTAEQCKQFLQDEYNVKNG